MTFLNDMQVHGVEHECWWNTNAVGAQFIAPTNARKN